MAFYALCRLSLYCKWRTRERESTPNDGCSLLNGSGGLLKPCGCSQMLSWQALEEEETLDQITGEDYFIKATIINLVIN